MGMTKTFDGQNCFSKFTGARIENLAVRTFGLVEYMDFSGYPLYSEWRAKDYGSGMWYGASVCVPAYVHREYDGSISIYNNTHNQVNLPT